MSKHTHTEWQREGNTVYALNIEGSNRFYLQVQGGWATQGRVRTDDAEIEANARLIAAAPELLEALIAANAELEMWRAGFPNYSDSEEVAVMIDEAIAKANGESA